MQFCGPALRHRSASTSLYILSIALAWFAGVAIAVIYTVTFVLGIAPTAYNTVVQDVALFSSLVIFVAAYMTIRTRMKQTVPSIEAHNRTKMDQNVKLSRTLFIVIALSLLFWLPSIALYTIQFECNECTIQEILLSISRVLHLSNAIVNPVVYSYRMPMFKEAMKRCLQKCSFVKRHGLG